jgi:hypothetical protein
MVACVNFERAPATVTAVTTPDAAVRNSQIFKQFQGNIS